MQSLIDSYTPLGEKGSGAVGNTRRETTSHSGKFTHKFPSISNVTISSGGPFAFCFNTKAETVFHGKGYLTENKRHNTDVKIPTSSQMRFGDGGTGKRVVLLDVKVRLL